MNISTVRFIRKNDCVTREIAGETIIVPVRDRVGDLDSVYTLNELGTFIWQLLDGQTSINQIVEAVCQNYDITPDEAMKDTLDFLRSLETRGLVDLKDERR